jgi:thiol-disulfide isomerase/thioredoxin
MLVSLVLLIAAVVGCVEDGASQDGGPRPPAPDFSLTRLDGQPVTLAEHRGKTVILDFWATWCAPCEVQMPVLDRLWKTRGGAELMVLGLSVDTDPADEVTAWVRKRELDYPIAIASQDLALDYGVMGFPTLIVVDPAGGIHTRHTGVLSRPELEEILEQIEREFAPEG